MVGNSLSRKRTISPWPYRLQPSTFSSLQTRHMVLSSPCLSLKSDSNWPLCSKLRTSSRQDFRQVKCQAACMGEKKAAGQTQKEKYEASGGWNQGRVEVRREASPRSTKSHTPKASLPYIRATWFSLLPSSLSNPTVTGHCAAGSKCPATMVSAGRTTQQGICKRSGRFVV